ncbi:MAG: cytochrome c oxidase assembly protein [Tepidisphaeraceae bacterium]
MSDDAREVFGSWSLDPGLLCGLLVALVLYVRGWRALRRTRPQRFSRARLCAFVCGILTIWVAIASPLDDLSGLLLSAHMVQHLLLLSVAPVLILLGTPWLPLLRGLPGSFLRDGLGPFLAWSALRRVARFLTHPVTCWLAMAITLLAWHVPAAFELALVNPGWHRVEHACFFLTSLLFWMPVVRPFPLRPHWPLWSVPLYLLAADVLNTALGAILTFSERVIYPVYDSVPRVFGSALQDQCTAGVIMWVPGSLIYLVPAAVIVVQLLSPSRPRISPHPRVAMPARQFDLLRVPIVGQFLRATAGRRAMQTLMLALAVLVIVDGFRGPRDRSVNLAGALPWDYWRALTVVALLAAGNLFCMACPFTLVRDLARRLRLPQRPWPRALRTKWFAVALIALFFWAYQAFALWDRPLWTAWIIISYFVGALGVDALFTGASFCKYVCPIGQFHFVTSIVSPTEVKVRNSGICDGCTTHDCIRGNPQHRGCEMDLFLPRKTGSLDCTFCLDCVRACPHDNIGLLPVLPLSELIDDSRRRPLGRLSARADVATLALMLVLAAFATAAAMVADAPPWRSLFTLGLAVVTAFALFATMSRTPVRALMCRFTMALVPVGTAMWAAHFLVHLLSGYESWGVRTDSILILQTLLLDAGLLATLYIVWRMARRLAIFAPWACIACALYACGIWIILRPMQMAGGMEAL